MRVREEVYAHQKTTPIPQQQTFSFTFIGFVHCFKILPDLLFRFFEQDFYEDIFEEMAKYGEIENLNVCDNTSDHMVGNVYVKFKEEEEAMAALSALNGRFYGGPRREMTALCRVMSSVP
jgi:hypothetical protein